MKRQAFCIHGHFYQPPREDPQTGDIPLEPGAVPYLNWNERIYHQCYRPNAELGNYEKISFNIGPTLVRWLSKAHPETLDVIIAQDRINLNRYKIGNAMAQAYDHIILPLANYQEKNTQVVWGIADFENHFGHKPLGMWLPETAVDYETLEVLVNHGIEYTILAPWQSKVDDLDVTQPYWVNLPNGKRIVVFFYHNISGQLSFNSTITSNADDFLKKHLIPQFPKTPRSVYQPQLLLIASDGEFYGHHQPYRDKFLSYLLNDAVQDQPVEISYPGLWMKQHPPHQTIEIIENTSWSCHHGVTRWMGSCNCTPHPEWKAPLRNALERIAQLIDKEYQEAFLPYSVDAWDIRDKYIQVIKGELSIEHFIRSEVCISIDGFDLQKISLLLEAQYERLRMFTSCGWFFDDFDRIEPRNNIAYAARAVRLVHQATGVNVAPQAEKLLRKVRSWRSGLWASTVFKHRLKISGRS